MEKLFVITKRLAAGCGLVWLGLAGTVGFAYPVEASPEARVTCQEVEGLRQLDFIAFDKQLVDDAQITIKTEAGEILTYPGQFTSEEGGFLYKKVTYRILNMEQGQITLKVGTGKCSRAGCTNKNIASAVTFIDGEEVSYACSESYQPFF